VAQLKRIRLGDLLVEHKLISEAQLEDALMAQKKTGRKLGRVLIENGYGPTWIWPAISTSPRW